jgi:hypothetical protein
VIIGLCESKSYKPWFDEERIKLVDRRKQAKLQCLQDPIVVNEGNLRNVRREASRHFRNKKRDYLKDKINEIELNSKDKNIDTFIAYIFSIESLCFYSFGCVSMSECRLRWPRVLRRRSWPLGYWNRRIESRCGHECLFTFVFLCCVVLCRQTPLRRADHSSKESNRVSQLRLRNLKNEEPRPDLGCRAIEKGQNMYN